MSGPQKLLLTLILLLAGLGGFLVWWLPESAKRRRVSNEQEAEHSLLLIRDAEFEFQAKDRDGNGIQDFWTADVSGLFSSGLIDRAIAEADAHPLVPLVPRPVPHQGYYFAALELDESVSPPEPYRTVTDVSSGKVHNLKKFAFVAYPSEPKVTGLYMFIVNERGTDFRANLWIEVPKNWPSDKTLKNYWSKFE